MGLPTRGDGERYVLTIQQAQQRAETARIPSTDIELAVPPAPLACSAASWAPR
jgi:hypothetical protein